MDIERVKHDALKFLTSAMNSKHLKKNMVHISEEEKREMIEDAKSLKRREDFEKLRRKKQSTFTFKWLEEIVKFVDVKYPGYFIKADKNVL